MNLGDWVTRYLLDTNVLIPLLWPRHTEQGAVRAWFQAHAAASFATCSLTQAGFLRITSSPEIMKERYALREARQLLLAFTQQPGHEFWPTTVDIFEATAPFERRMHGPKQITDAYLLGIAKHHGGRLATLDKAIKSLAGPEFSGLVELIG
jgi:toxin-antitoxin system PIN domain toxin